MATHFQRQMGTHEVIESPYKRIGWVSSITGSAVSLKSKIVYRVISLERKENPLSFDADFGSRAPVGRGRAMG